MEWTGGCLCGEVRYRADAAPAYASYCHCGMCQKVSGAPFMGFVEFPKGAVQWTAENPDQYRSSEGVIRRFCGRCGSSLTFEADGVFFISLGSLDRPEQVAFDCHTYTQSRLPGITLNDGLPHFPGPAGGKGGRAID
ncbi:MAG: GFA family protein [Alphaproteobacteria bacterium]|nr:GFA family protein [Alphaproteobacteria bacterium]